ncbi:MAG: holo-[acyl-carrier-protein] synthase [Candidatus Omnitrophota bacterium]|nr:MAG: holo-[acyl-carrier-protein] synthase [Candidatus Omnitrophota bacterium]
MDLRCGVDLIEVERIKKAVDKWGQRLLYRIFTRTEIEFARARRNFYQHLAGRFAAKEAIIKSLGKGRISWREMEIVNNAEGEPRVRFTSEGRINKTVAISISHTKDYAIAQAIAYEQTHLSSPQIRFA